MYIVSRPSDKLENRVYLSLSLSYKQRLALITHVIRWQTGSTAISISDCAVISLFRLRQRFTLPSSLGVSSISLSIVPPTCILSRWIFISLYYPASTWLCLTLPTLHTSHIGPSFYVLSYMIPCFHLTLYCLTLFLSVHWTSSPSPGSPEIGLDYIHKTAVESACFFSAPPVFACRCLAFLSLSVCLYRSVRQGRRVEGTRSHL